MDTTTLKNSRKGHADNYWSRYLRDRASAAFGQCGDPRESQGSGAVTGGDRGAWKVGGDRSCGVYVVQPVLCVAVHGCESLHSYRSGESWSKAAPSLRSCWRRSRGMWMMSWRGSSIQNMCLVY